MTEKNNEDIDDATAVLSNQIIDDTTALIDEATIVVGGLSSVEEETVTNSNPMEENTISSTRTGESGKDFTFTGTGEAAPTPTRAIEIVESIPEPDAALNVESFVNPDVANQELKVNKIAQAQVLDIPEYDDRIVRTPPVSTRPNTLNDAAKLMNKNERRAKQGMLTVIIVVLGAALIGAVIAVLVNGN